MNHCAKEEEYETFLYAVWVRSMVHTCYVKDMSYSSGLSVMCSYFISCFIPLDMSLSFQQLQIGYTMIHSVHCCL